MSEIPTRIAIGTQKAASTYLYNLLASHPEVALSERTEVNFYNTHFEKGINWYTDSFAETGNRIDISPKYFMHGAVVAERLKETLGQTPPKLLLILRNPIDYLASHFLMQQQQGFFANHPDYPSAPKELLAFIERFPEYAARGRYHATFSQLWLPHFPLTDFKIVFFEELTDPQSAAAVLADIQTFWGLPVRELTAPAASKNSALRSPLLHQIKHFVVHRPKLKRFLKRQSWFDYIYERFLTQQTKKALSSNTRAVLAQKFHADVHALETVLGRTAPWSDFHKP